MEYKVFKYLVNAPCRLVRLSDMAEVIQCSEAQITACVDRLSAAGYDIVSGPNGDVRLLNLTDVLDKNSIRLMLEYASLEEDVVFNRVTGSTNSDAKLLAQSGFCGVVAAERQSAGRGRRGRSFSAEPGGAYFSYVKKPGSMTAGDIQRVVLLVGVGIVDALSEFGVSATLKWPNDVCVGDKKISGILCEMVAEDNRVSSLIVGVGVNVNQAEFDCSIQDIATSIFLETGVKNLRCEIIASVIRSVLKYDVSKNGYGEVLDRYRKLSNTIGRDVYIIEDSKKFAAHAVDINDAGFLMVECEGTVRPIYSGDVSVRRIS